MQEINIYAIYDKKGGQYDQPFFAYNDLFAKRKFIMLSQDKNIALGNFTKDFELKNLGSFNVLTGDIKPLNQLILEGNQIQKEKGDYDK